jgi:hypothetical protein
VARALPLPKPALPSIDLALTSIKESWELHVPPAALD